MYPLTLGLSGVYQIANVAALPQLTRSRFLQCIARLRFGALSCGCALCTHMHMPQSHFQLTREELAPLQEMADERGKPMAR
jgi:hypothetical protein